MLVPAKLIIKYTSGSKERDDSQNSKLLNIISLTGHNSSSFWDNGIKKMEKPCIIFFFNNLTITLTFYF